jgi:hypothetical protein
VLDYFWIAISGCRGRVHVQDGTTVEWTYQPNEIRHGRVGKGDFTVHDLENIGDHEMVFVTVEFKDSLNTPIALPSGGTRQYGSVLSMICAIDATLVADFFLYNPGYTLYVSDPRQAGELFLFGLTALIGAKCTAELMRQVTKPF